MVDPTTPAKKRPARLGRGLSSLMAHPVSIQPPAAALTAAKPTTHAVPSEIQADRTAAPNGTGGSHDPEGLRYVPVDLISPNPFQPREHFDGDSLDALAASIRSEGMMQPLVVRRRPQDDGQPTRYELVAGERRWRAAQQAGLSTVPALVRNINDAKAAQWALIENLQREDLNPMERAVAFQRLIDRFGLNHEQVAEQVGVQRPTISNYLRLLSLHSNVQDMIRHSLLSAGHAKPLAALSDVELQQTLARKVVAGGWSVRRVEQEVARLTSAASGPVDTKAGGRERRSALLADLEQQLADQLATKVHIRPGRKKGSGTLCIDFYSLDQFDQLMTRFGLSTE